MIANIEDKADNATDVVDACGPGEIATTKGQMGHKAEEWWFKGGATNSKKQCEKQKSTMAVLHSRNGGNITESVNHD